MISNNISAACGSCRIPPDYAYKIHGFYGLLARMNGIARQTLPWWTVYYIPPFYDSMGGGRFTGRSAYCYA